MSEDAVVRQTRSQKRALERDSLPAAPPPSHSHSPTPLGHESEGKRPRLEVVGEGLGREERTTRAHGPEGIARSAVLLGGGGTAEVKATIKVEVQTGGEPVDMSTNNMSEIKREKHLPSPDDDDDDVIVLSDNESPSPKINGHFKQFDTELLMESSPEERERVIKQLKEELRLEEAKLVLLKRLRQSQLTKAVAGGSVATPPPLVRGSLTAVKGSQQGLSGRNTGTVIPPPLVRGGQQVSKHGVHNSHTIMPPLVRGAPPISVSPQQLQSLRHQQHQHHQHQQHHHHQHHHHQHSSSGSGSGSGPPPLLMAPRSSGTTGVVQGHKLLQTGNLSSPTNLKSLSSGVGSQQGVAGGNQGGVADSPASRQAAAKLALRKQLEKTLLEIPPPQPPSPEFYFLPSAANNEFIYLIGLEEVVQTLLDLGRAKLGLPLASTSATSSGEPFTCSQCQTDFTCRWRQDKGGATLCEQCMSSNQKKALKAEHTARLKAAFVKALQQEQEMEQCLLQQTTAAQTTSSSSSSNSSLSAASSAMHMVKTEHLTKQRSSLQHHHLSQSNPNVARHQASIKQAQNAGQLSRGGSQVQASALGLGVSLGVRGVPHSFSSSSQLQSAVAAAALVARPGVTMAYVNPSLSVHKTSSSSPSSSSSSSSSAVERQREYLLDMLPSRSLSQTTANTWK